MDFSANNKIQEFAQKTTNMVALKDILVYIQVASVEEEVEFKSKHFHPRSIESVEIRCNAPVINHEISIPEL